MGIESERIYSVLDTSQLINLFNKNKISLLNSRGFLKNYGFPCLFYEHLLELAKTNDFHLFSKNISMLEAVDTFRTLKTDDGSPYSIFRLLQDEIFLHSKYGRIDAEILEEYIFENIVEYKLDIPNNMRQALYGRLHEEAIKSALISVLPGNITNPNFRKKISALEKDKVVLRPMDSTQVAKSVSKFMDKRLKNKSEKNELEKKFYDHQSDKIKDVKTPMDFAKEYLGQNIEQNQTMEDLSYNGMFSKLKQLTIESHQIREANIARLSYDDLILNKIFYRSQKYLANVYITDKERKIESSDIYDIYFLVCSPIFKVFVDKRIFDLGKKIEKELSIKLNIEKNTHE